MKYSLNDTIKKFQRKKIRISVLKIENLEVNFDAVFGSYSPYSKDFKRINKSLRSLLSRVPLRTLKQGVVK
ncbi:hypothetical protein [Chryseobacterium wanjuense]